MCCDWFSVYLENHLNLVIAQTIRYLTMSSLAAFRSLRVVKKLGEQVGPKATLLNLVIREALGDMRIAFRLNGH